MEIQEICDRANRGEELPERLQLHDQLLFLSLRHVYSDFHAGKIDLEAAKREKHRLLYQHQLQEQRQNDALDSALRYQQIIISTEGSRSDLCRLIQAHADPEQIVSVACRLVEALDGIQVKEARDG